MLQLEYPMRNNPHQTVAPLALAVLELLHERPMHPYEMHQTIRDRFTDQVVKVRAGSLYHAVERLHRGGLIAPVETGRAGRRPERTIYAITDTGRDEFRLNLRHLVRQPAEEFPVFAAAVQMLHKLDCDEALELLDRRALAREAEIAGLDQVLTGLAKEGMPRINLIEVEYTVAMARAELTWIRNLTDDVRGGALRWPDPTDPKEPA
jgi:DNA-binding PadR family transcriptional regulator